MHAKSTLCLMTLLLLLAGPAAAKDSKSRAAPASAEAAYTWYDNGTARRVWVDPDLVAEIGGQDHQAHAPAARGRVRVLAARSPLALDARQRGHTSPVLRDRPGGPLRALPGGVVLRLDPSWSEREARYWLESQGLVARKKLPVGGNAYLLEAAPGLPSLELANRLHGLSGVVGAQPEWWQERVPR